MIRSMTGFASAQGAFEAFSWSWDIRSVNARGLDVRLRMPDWIEGLEEACRKSIKENAARGSVTLSLKLTKADEQSALTVNGAALERNLALFKEISVMAQEHGLDLAPMTAADVAVSKGVLEHASGPVADTQPLRDAILAQLPDLIAGFVDNRAQEGAELLRILGDRVDEIERLVVASERLLDARTAAQTEGLKQAVDRVLENADGVDPERLAQELAILAVKTDVREELDRLKAHIEVARTHLASGEVVGRKLDFLTQEFNREANTLCSKAQFKELTAIGLDLKHVIDQIREQVQNVE